MTSKEKRPNGYWKNMSNEDLIHYARSNHFEDTLEEFQKSKDTAGYNECLKRKIKTEDGREINIKDFLIEEGTLIDLYADRRDWKNMSGWDLIHYVRSNHFGDSIGDFQKESQRGYNKIRKMKIKIEDGREVKVLDFLIGEGTLIRKQKPDGYWKNISDWDFIHEMRSNYYGSTLGEFQIYAGGGYCESKERKIKTEDGIEIRILDFLVEEGTLIDKYADRMDWKNMSDWDLIHYVRSQHFEDTISEFQRTAEKGCGECRTRNIKLKDGREIRILDFLVEEGTLIRKCEGYPKPNGDLGSLVRRYMKE